MSSYLELKRRALMMGSGAWWCPNGFDASVCLAAYDFKTSVDQSDALRDITGHGYNLSIDGSNVTYNQGSGFYFGGGWSNGHGKLNNSSLINQSVQSIIIRFSGLSGNLNFLSRVNNGFGVIVNEGTTTGADPYTITDIHYKECQYYTWWDEGSDATRSVFVHGPNNSRSAGIFGTNRAWGDPRYYGSSANIGEVYRDGVKETASTYGRWTNGPGAEGSWKAVFGGGYASGWNVPYGSFTIVAGAFFNRWLTEAEHLAIAESLAAL